MLDPIQCLLISSSGHKWSCVKMSKGDSCRDADSPWVMQVCIRVMERYHHPYKTTVDVQPAVSCQDKYGQYPRPEMQKGYNANYIRCPEKSSCHCWDLNQRSLDWFVSQCRATWRHSPYWCFMMLSPAGIRVGVISCIRSRLMWNKMTLENNIDSNFEAF
jgi:hypothetical protein